MELVKRRTGTNHRFYDVNREIEIVSVLVTTTTTTTNIGIYILCVCHKSHITNNITSQGSMTYNQSSIFVKQQSEYTDSSVYLVVWSFFNKFLAPPPQKKKFVTTTTRLTRRIRTCACGPSNNSTMNVNETTTKTIQLRLHLVRHGETMANLQNNVIGQSDSVSF